LTCPPAGHWPSPSPLAVGEETQVSALFIAQFGDPAEGAAYSSGHPTGQQAWCAPCLTIGRYVPGVSRGETAAGEPMCLGCWGRDEGLLPPRPATSDMREARRAAKRALRMAAAGRRARAAVELGRARQVRKPRRVRRRRRSQVYSRPVEAFAVGLFVLRRSGMSRTVLRTREAVWLDMVVDAAQETGRASRPGRADAAARTGTSEATVRRAWAELVALGLADRGNRGGEVSHRALVAAGAVCVCRMPRRTAAKVRAEARAEGRQVCRWRERAEFDLADARTMEALGVCAEDVEPLLPEAQAAFTAYADRLAPDLTAPVPVVAPPSPVDPFATDGPTDQGGGIFDAPPTRADGFPRAEPSSVLIIRRRTPSGGSPSRPTASPQRRHRRGRALDRDAVGLAEQLIERAIRGGLLAWLGTAKVPMLASMLEARGWAQATPAQVEREAYDQLTRGVHSVPATVAKPVAWLARWLPPRVIAAKDTVVPLPFVDATPAPSAAEALVDVRRPQSVRPCGGGNCSGPTRAIVCSHFCPADCSGVHRAHGLPGSCPACG